MAISVIKESNQSYVFNFQHNTFALEHLRDNVTHIYVNIRILRVEYLLDLDNFIDQSEHSIVLRILQGFANRSLNENTGDHVRYSDHH